MQPDGPEGPSDGAARRSTHLLPEGALLPIQCPLCGAEGTRPLPVPTPHAGGEPHLDAYYCDLCAEEEQKRTTRKIAVLGAAGLLTLASVTALALSLGSRGLGWQVALGALVGLSLPEILIRTGLWPPSRLPLEFGTRQEAQGSAPTGHLLYVEGRKFRAALTAGGAPPCDIEAPPQKKEPRGVLLLSFGGLALAWLVLIHSLGGATVRVVLGGTETSTLLIDNRHSGEVQPANAEDPRAGRFAHVLGGRRHLQLQSEKGEILADQSVTVWPGRTYIVGHLPKGQCLFWEKRTYGPEKSGTFLFPLSGSGPIWELKERVDSWFLPLGEGSADSPTATDEWETSGGERRAVRLLPCLSPGR